MRRCAILVCVLLIMMSAGVQGANLNVSIASIRERFAKADCVFDYSPLADGTPRWLGDFGKRTTVELTGKTQLTKATMVAFFNPADIKTELLGPILEVALAAAVCMPRSAPEDVASTISRLFSDAVTRGGKAQLKQDGIVILGEVTIMSLAAGIFIVTINP